MTPVGSEDEVDAQSLDRVGERPQLIAGGRGNPPADEGGRPSSADQTRAACSGTGSAQQYHGSFR